MNWTAHGCPPSRGGGRGAARSGQLAQAGDSDWHPLLYTARGRCELGLGARGGVGGGLDTACGRWCRVHLPALGALQVESPPHASLHCTEVVVGWRWGGGRGAGGGGGAAAASLRVRGGRHVGVPSLQLPSSLQLPFFTPFPHPPHTRSPRSSSHHAQAVGGVGWRASHRPTPHVAPSFKRASRSPPSPTLVSARSKRFPARGIEPRSSGFTEWGHSMRA